MLREIQVHFENQGSISWHDEIADVDVWFNNISKQGFCVAVDKDTGRHFLLQMRSVTAIMVDEKKKDIFERTYAPEER
jgi:hypothetical protein